MDAVKYVVQCPAKLNLFLAVGPKDDRGWHPLRTIFQTIALFDTLTAEPGYEDQVLSNAVWLPAENTAFKALQLAREHLEFPRLNIHLQKSIPAESGLGGGSSDAAAVLRLANSLSRDPLDREGLIRLGARIGADVPFFLIGGRAKAEGYGEWLTPSADPPTSYLLVARPRFGCSTPQMYKALDAQQYTWREFPEGDELYNDFLRVAPQECHVLVERLLTFGALDASLTGSGSAVFGRFENLTAAETAESLLKAEGWEHLWATRTLGRAESLSIKS